MICVSKARDEDVNAYSSAYGCCLSSCYALECEPEIIFERHCSTRCSTGMQAVTPADCARGKGGKSSRVGGRNSTIAVRWQTTGATREGKGNNGTDGPGKQASKQRKKWTRMDKK
jgi:hypothetical protein